MPQPPRIVLPTAEEVLAAQRERLEHWRAILTDRDWVRIADLATRAAAGEATVRIEDLDAPGVAVGVCRPDMARYYNGEVLMKHAPTGYLVLAWAKT